MWLARLHSQRSEVATASWGRQSVSVVQRALRLAVVMSFLGTMVADDLAFGQKRGFGGGSFRGGGFGGGFGGGGFRGGGFSHQPSFRPPPPTFRPKPAFRPPPVAPPVSVPKPLPRPASPPPLRGSNQKAVPSLGKAQGIASRPPPRSSASLRAQQARKGIGTRLIQVKGMTYRVPQHAVSKVQKSTCGIGKAGDFSRPHAVTVSYVIRVQTPYENCALGRENVEKLSNIIRKKGLTNIFNECAKGEDCTKKKENYKQPEKYEEQDRNFDRLDAIPPSLRR